MMHESDYWLKVVIEPENCQVYSLIRAHLDNLSSKSYEAPIYSESFKITKNSKNAGESLGVEIYSFIEKNVLTDSDISHLQLWVINPAERFRKMKESFIQGALVKLTINQSSGLENLATSEEVKEAIKSLVKEKYCSTNKK